MSWDLQAPNIADLSLTSAPLVVSASRRCDIPAFQGNWLMERLREGNVDVRNPFNGKIFRVSLERLRLLVFWSKNPQPLMRYLPEMGQRGLHFYFQYTLNDYTATGWEPGLPSLQKRIDTFRALADTWGAERVIWRFDPLMISPRFSVEELQERIFRLGEELSGSTQKLIFSFAQVENYRKVKSRFRRNAVEWRDFSSVERRQMIRFLQTHAKTWAMEPAICCDPEEQMETGISAAKCIDPELVDKILRGDPLWEEQRGRAMRLDKGQRPGCACMLSRDIGTYDTCEFNCVYCYAKR